MDIYSVSTDYWLLELRNTHVPSSILCLTNSPDEITISGVIDIGISDHCSIFLIRKISHFRSGVSKTAEVGELNNFNEDEFLRDFHMNDWNTVHLWKITQMKCGSLGDTL